MGRRRRFKPEPPIYRFRVRLLGGFYAPEDARSIWREIEIAANQTLAELGETIPLAFEFDDPHLWSFFLSGKAWDTTTEYTLAAGAAPVTGLVPVARGAQARLAGAVQIRDVPYPGATGKQEFLFLFDYGDEWHFGVKLLGTSPIVEPGADYPRVVASAGEAPPQYPDLDDEDEAEEDNAPPGGAGPQR